MVADPPRSNNVEYKRFGEGHLGASSSQQILLAVSKE